MSKTLNIPAKFRVLFVLLFNPLFAMKAGACSTALFSGFSSMNTRMPSVRAWATPSFSSAIAKLHQLGDILMVVIA